MHKPTYADHHGRFTKAEVEQILSPANRWECRQKLHRAPLPDDLIEHWLEKRKETPQDTMVCGISA